MMLTRRYITYQNVGNSSHFFGTGIFGEEGMYAIRYSMCCVEQLKLLEINRMQSIT